MNEQNMVASLLAKLEASIALGNNKIFGFTQEQAEMMCKTINGMVPIHFVDVTVESAECVWLAKHLDDKDRESDPEYDGPQVADFIEFYEPLLKLEGVDEKILLRNFERQYNLKFNSSSPNVFTRVFNGVKLMSSSEAYNLCRKSKDEYSHVFFAHKGSLCALGPIEVMSKEVFLERLSYRADYFNPNESGTHFLSVRLEERVETGIEEVGDSIIILEDVPIHYFEAMYDQTVLQANKNALAKLKKYGPDILRMPLSKYANEWLRSHYHIKLVDQSLCYEVADYNAGFYRVDDVVSIQAENGKDVLYVEITNLVTEQGIALPLGTFLEDFKFTCNHIDRKLDDQIIMQLLAMDEAYDYNVENEIE